MKIRTASLADAPAITEIYAPIVAHTTISFELEPPTVDEMGRRISSTLETLPWLVAVDDDDRVRGYAYAGRHRERPAYQWAVDVTAYVHKHARGQGVGRALYAELFAVLVDLGYCQAFAGIALPNAASVALHESVGFEAVGVYLRVGFKHGAWRDVGWWQKALQVIDEPRQPSHYRAPTSL